MINIPPIKPSTEIKTEPLPEVTKIWKVGQVLNARAETGSDALGKAALRIGQYLVEARTPIPLKEGESIKVLVKSLGDPPLLSILTPTSTAGLAANKLKAFIAQQQSLLNLIKISQELIADKNTPIKIKQLISDLINKLPTTDQVIDAKQLKQLIQSSGIFLESKILNLPGPNIQQDLKALLLRIKSYLQATGITSETTNKDNPKQLQIKNILTLQELATGIDHALAKITSQQLIPLTREADNFLLLLFDLLIKDKEGHHLINFKIEEEKNNKENKHSSWAVTINFEFESLGAIEAKIHLIENRVSTLFNVEKPGTAKKIEQHIGLLETAYKKIGLDIIKLDISQKILNKELKIPDDIHLLDEKA